MDIPTSLNTIQQLITEGKLSVEALVSHYLDRIKNTNDLNAYVHVFTDDALAKAKALDEKRRSGQKCGSLLGAVFSIKDNICIQGKPVSAASKILNNYISPFSATAVERLVAEDAIIIGTTNCDEFGMGSASLNSVYGPVHNGKDKNLIAGGSSGGAAVSIQMETCLFALGSDTGGSIRQPAALCDVIGFKPGYGSVSRYGLIAYASSFDQIGILGHDLAGIQLVYDIIKGPDEYDSTMSAIPETTKLKSKLKVAIIPTMFDPANPFTSACEKAIRSAFADHSIHEQSFDFMKFLVPCYYILTTAESSSNLSRYDGVRYGYRSTASSSLEEMYVNTRIEGFGTEVKKRIMLGTFVLSEGYFDAYYQKAQKVRRKIKDQIDEILAHHDVIAMPVTPGPAWPLEHQPKDEMEIYLSDIYTVLANITGLPSLTIPVEFNGQTVNFQLLGQKGSENNLLEMAMQIKGLKEKGDIAVVQR